MFGQFSRIKALLPSVNASTAERLSHWRHPTPPPMATIPTTTAPQVPESGVCTTEFWVIVSEMLASRSYDDHGGGHDHGGCSAIAVRCDESALESAVIASGPWLSLCKRHWDSLLRYCDDARVVEVCLTAAFGGQSPCGDATRQRILGIVAKRW